MAAGLELTRAKSDRYREALGALEVPVQVLWGVKDPVLKLEREGASVLEFTGAPLQRLPGKHFLQEDCFAAIADHVARLAAKATVPDGRVA
jgi:haloalkane dehalogenase